MFKTGLWPLTPNSDTTVMDANQAYEKYRKELDTPRGTTLIVELDDHFTITARHTFTDEYKMMPMVYGLGASAKNYIILDYFDPNRRYDFCCQTFEKEENLDTQEILRFSQRVNYSLEDLRREFQAFKNELISKATL